MVDSLKYLFETLAAWPDNTQGLIDAQAGREGWSSSAVALGVAIDETGGTVGPGVDVDVNAALNLAYLGGQAVVMDANGHLYHDYNVIDVPVGYTRLVLMQAQFSFTSTTNTATSFLFGVNGVAATHTEVIVDWSSQSVAIPVTVTGWWGLDCNPADSVSLLQTRTGGDSLITNFQFSLLSFQAADAASSGGEFFQGVNWE